MNKELQRVLDARNRLPQFDSHGIGEELLELIFGDFDWGYYHYNGTDINLSECFEDWQVIHTCGFGMQETCTFTDLEGNEIEGDYDAYDAYIDKLSQDQWRKVEDTFECGMEIEHYGEFLQTWINVNNGKITQFANINDKGQYNMDDSHWQVVTDEREVTYYHHDLSVHHRLVECGYNPLEITESLRDLINTNNNISVYNHYRYFILYGDYIKDIANLYGEDTAMRITYNSDLATAYKIAKRHGYTIADINKWIGYINKLNELGKDLHNPHFVCPQDIDKANDEVDRSIARRRERQAHDLRIEAYKAGLVREKEAQEIIDSVSQFSVEYRENMSKYFNLTIEGSDFTIKPLSSVAEFKEEADFMHHCVFRNGYFYKFNHLILSAKSNDGERLVTIDLDLRTMKVLQCFTVKDKIHPRDNEFRKAIADNIGKIKALKRAV